MAKVVFVGSSCWRRASTRTPRRSPSTCRSTATRVRLAPVASEYVPHSRRFRFVQVRPPSDEALRCDRVAGAIKATAAATSVTIESRRTVHTGSTRRWRRRKAQVEGSANTTRPSPTAAPICVSFLHPRTCSSASAGADQRRVVQSNVRLAEPADGDDVVVAGNPHDRFGGRPSPRKPAPDRGFDVARRPARGTDRPGRFRSCAADELPGRLSAIPANQASTLDARSFRCWPGRTRPRRPAARPARRWPRPGWARTWGPAFGTSAFSCPPDPCRPFLSRTPTRRTVAASGPTA